MLEELEPVIEEQVKAHESNDWKRNFYSTG